jgi:flagella basal body P-ring formation protein FlgA
VGLGALFAGLPAAEAATAVAQAPAPGRPVTVDARWLARVAEAFGVAWEDAGPAARLTIARASRRIPAADVAALVRQAVEERLGEERLGEGRVDVSFDAPAADIHLPAGADPTIAVADVSWQPSSGRFSVLIAAPAEAPTIRVPVSGRAVAMAMVPVLARRLGTREVIGDADIQWAEVPVDRLGPTVVRDPAELVGMSPRRSIAPETPVRAEDVRLPVVIARGEAVTMVVRHGGLTVTARGRALDEGARGATIRVMNIDSKRTIEAMVTGPGAVEVGGGLAAAAVN